MDDPERGDGTGAASEQAAGEEAAGEEQRAIDAAGRERSLAARRARIRAVLDGDDLLPDVTADETGPDSGSPVPDGGSTDVLRRYLAEKPPHHVDP